MYTWQVTSQQVSSSVPVTCKEWIAGRGGFAEWKTMSEHDRRTRHLARKYGMRWLRKWKMKCQSSSAPQASRSFARSSTASGSRSGTLNMKSDWLKLLLLNRASAAVRAASKALVIALAEASSHRALATLKMLTSMLNSTALAEEDCSDLVNLMVLLTNTDERKRFVVAHGFLEQLVRLVSDEVGRISSMEALCAADVSQGSSLKSLLKLLDSLLQVLSRPVFSCLPAS
jgi:hypothetical protein